MVQKRREQSMQDSIHTQKMKHLQIYTLSAIEKVLHEFSDANEEEFTTSQLKALEDLYDAYARFIEA